MLDRGCDDVVAFAAKREGHAFQGMIVGLAAAAGEDDLVARAAKQSGDLARALSRAPRAPAARPNGRSMDCRRRRPETGRIAAATSGAIGVLAL